MAYDFDAIVLAGGAGRRMGGADKAMLEVGGVSLLERALAAVDGAGTIVVVGPHRPTLRSHSAVKFVRETPAGCGPAAAVMRGLADVTNPVVVVIAVDAPFAASAVPRLLAALPGHDAAMCEAAMLIDDTGRRQPLLAAYATEALRHRNAAGPWANRSVHDLVDGLAVVDVQPVGDEWLDVDTPDDARRARAAATRRGFTAS